MQARGRLIYQVWRGGGGGGGGGRYNRMYCEGQLHEKEIVDILFISNCMTPNKKQVCMYVSTRKVS